MEKARLAFLVNNGFVAFITFIAILISIFVLSLHFRVLVFRQEFFQVVCGITIVEFLLYLVIFSSSILNLIFIDSQQDFKDKMDNYMSALFDIFFTMLISYLIVVIIFIYSKSTSYDKINAEETVNKGRDTEYSVVMLSHSYSLIHIISILSGLIHSVLVILLKIFLKNYFVNFTLITFLRGDLEKDPQSVQHRAKLISVLLYIPHYFLLIFSLYYLSKSWDKTRVSDKYLIKSFGVNNFVFALLSLVFPVSFLISYFITKITKEPIALRWINIGFVFIFLLLMLKLIHYRVSRYYVQTILGLKANCCEKMISFFKILCCGEIKDPDFVDFNSMFIYHSLYSEFDFVSDNMDEKYHERIDNFDVYSVSRTSKASSFDVQ